VERLWLIKGSSLKMRVDPRIVIRIIPRIRAFGLVSSGLSRVIESLLSYLSIFIYLPLLIHNDFIQFCNLFL
jgi:hypothetical protein